MEFISAAQHIFDENKPSLFELLSEHQLSVLLPPTVRYLLTVATHRRPRYLLHILNAFDEVYALAAFLVEGHYLRTRGGSFTEHFYGLKREPALQGELPRATHAAPHAVRDALRLRDADVWRNLAVIVGVPYLKRKLDEAHEVNAPRALLGATYTRLPAGATWRERLLCWWRWFLLKMYPGVNAGYHITVLAFQMAYLFDASKYPSPFLWVIRTRIRRMNAADYQVAEKSGQGATTRGSAGSTSIFSPRNAGARLLGGLSLVLPTSIFALKFLEWWYASDFAKQLSREASESLSLPPPVLTGLEMRESWGRKIDKEKEKDIDSQAGSGSENEKVPDAEKAPIATPSLLPIYTVETPKDSRLCPICEDDIATATACQTGVVYCYTCIHRWLTGSHPKQERFMADKTGKWESGAGRCAVTGRRVLGGTEGLRRIMV